MNPIHAKALEFAKTQQLAVLSTVTPEGQPQAALVGFAVTLDFEVIFDCRSPTRKVRNLEHNASCSFVFGFGAVTVQFEGEARVLQPGLERDQLLEQFYFPKFPDGRTRMSWPGILHYIVKPRWLRMADYRTPPPVIEEAPF